MKLQNTLKTIKVKKHLNDRKQNSTSVTGGSRGLGRDMAINFAKKGIDVIITYHSNIAAVNEVVAEINTLGSKGKAFQLDTSNINGFNDFFWSSFNLFKISNFKRLF